MEEDIVKDLYQKYLKELFDADKTSLSDLSYSIQIADDKYVFSRNSEHKTYELVGQQCDGYSLVKTEEGYNFIDGDGNFLLTEWLDDAASFSNGYACVSKNGKSSFIDTNGRYILGTCPLIDKYSSSFNENGIARINFIGGKTTVLDKDGNFLFYNRFKYIDYFYGSTALAYNLSSMRLKSDKDKNYKSYYIISADGSVTNLGYKYSDVKQVDENIFLAHDDKINRTILIDKTGSRIGNVEFDTCSYYAYRSGYLLIYKDGCYNILDTDCNLVFDTWFESLSIPYEGFAVIKKSNKYDFVDLKGNILSSKWFDYANSFEDGNAVVKIDDKEYLIDTNGKLLDYSYDKIFSSYNGYRVVKKDNKYNVISKEGKVLSDTWFFESYYKVQDNNLRLVENEQGLENYADLEGNLILAEWKENLTLISEGLFGSVEGTDLVIYNLEGNKVYTIPNVNTADLYTSSFRVQIATPKAQKLNYSKRLFRYYYNDGVNTYVLLGEPLADYGKIIIVSIAENAYAYNKNSKNMQLLGRLSDIKVEANYVIVSGIKYFISGSDIIDISEIDFKRRIDLKLGIDRVKTPDEFREMCRTQEYQDIINDELEKASQKRAADEQAKITLELEEKRNEKRKLLEAKQEVLKSSLTDLSKMIAECSKYITEIQGIINDNSNDKINVPADLLLVKVNEHYEFNPIFLATGILKYIDLSMISFQDVKISGVDLSYTNANIDPQKVYKKDMSNGKYCGLDFNLSDFTDVKIDNADFTDAIIDFIVNSTPKK